MEYNAMRGGVACEHHGEGHAFAQKFVLPRNQWSGSIHVAQCGHSITLAPKGLATDDLCGHTAGQLI
jgi:hypothetical protein